MTLVDWHPEDLLDKHYAGTLSTSEEDTLAQHTAACSTCRFELLLEGDFESELLRAGTLPVALSPKRIPAVLVMAAALVIAGAAAAIVRVESNLPRYVAVPKIAEAIARAQNAGAPAAMAVPVAPATTAAPATPTERHVADAPPASAGVLLSASELFARGNAARRDGRRVEALALYRELQQRYPTSPEAKLSQATMGRMLLDDDPARALDQFDSYLEGKGDLAEEAVVGRALSLMRLGDRAGERRAWEALLARHPKSIHAGRARTRLAELAAPE